MRRRLLLSFLLGPILLSFFIVFYGTWVETAGESSGQREIWFAVVITASLGSVWFLCEVLLALLKLLGACPNRW